MNRLDRTHCSLQTVVLLQPKHRLDHPEYYSFSLSKEIFSGSKYPKSTWFHFENRSTAWEAHVLCCSEATERVGTPTWPDWLAFYRMGGPPRGREFGLAQRAWQCGVCGSGQTQNWDSDRLWRASNYRGNAKSSCMATSLSTSRDRHRPKRSAGSSGQHSIRDPRPEQPEPRRWTSVPYGTQVSSWNINSAHAMLAIAWCM